MTDAPTIRAKSRQASHTKMITKKMQASIIDAYAAYADRYPSITHKVVRIAAYNIQLAAQTNSINPLEWVISVLTSPNYTRRQKAIAAKAAILIIEEDKAKQDKKRRKS